MANEKLDVLAVAAHPDDLEITCAAPSRSSSSKATTSASLT